MAKALVAYFSASGVTKKLAENLAGAIGNVDADHTMELLRDLEIL